MKMTADHLYWSARAEAELGRARQAACHEAREAHLKLAGLYLERVQGEPSAGKSHIQLVR